MMRSSPSKARFTGGWALRSGMLRCALQSLREGHRPAKAGRLAQVVTDDAYNQVGIAGIGWDRALLRRASVKPA
jgi:hypothetical protein